MSQKEWQKDMSVAWNYEFRRDPQAGNPILRSTSWHQWFSIEYRETDGYCI